MEKTVEITAMAGKKLQWHQAIYAGIQIEFAIEADKLVFENEHNIGTQPKRIQLLVTKDLADEENLWLHNLTNDIRDKDVMNTLILEYKKHEKDTHYKSIMDIITHANKDTFKEVSVVCQALEELYWEVHGERIMREQKEALDKAVAEVRAEVRAENKAVLAEKEAYIKQLEARLGIVSA